VRIQRTVAFTQDTVLVPGTRFPAKSVERAHDRGVYQAQQLDRRVTKLETEYVLQTGPQGATGPQGPPGVDGQEGPSVYDVLVFFAGPPLDAQLLARVLIPRAVTVPATCAGAHANAGTSATAPAVVTLKKNGVAVGTVTFNADGSAVFSCADPIAFSPGDMLTFHAPDTADATLADISLTLVGSI
jgi:hypothetical protein